MKLELEIKCSQTGSIYLLMLANAIGAMLLSSPTLSVAKPWVGWSVASVTCVCDCGSVCPHSERKTATAINTKLGKHAVHGSCLAYIDYKSKRSKFKVMRGRRGCACRQGCLKVLWWCETADRDPTVVCINVVSPQMNSAVLKIWLAVTQSSSRHTILATNSGIIIIPDSIVRLCCKPTIHSSQIQHFWIIRYQDGRLFSTTVYQWWPHYNPRQSIQVVCKLLPG